jgi:hypothetical protein
MHALDRLWSKQWRVTVKDEHITRDSPQGRLRNENGVAGTELLLLQDEFDIFAESRPHFLSFRSDDDDQSGRRKRFRVSQDVA